MSARDSVAPGRGEEPPARGGPAVAWLRRRVLGTMAVLVVAATFSALLALRHHMFLRAEGEMEEQIQATITHQQALEAVRRAALVRWSRALAEQPALRVALERGGVAAVYAAAGETLRGVVESEHGAPWVEADEAVGAAADDRRDDVGVHAEFVRFLDRSGDVLDEGWAGVFGRLEPEEQAQLALPKEAIEIPQVGYLRRSQVDGDGPVFDLIGMPVRGREEGPALGMLVMGFESANRLLVPAVGGVVPGVWVDGQLFLATAAAPAPPVVARAVAAALAGAGLPGPPPVVAIAGATHRIFFHQQNPGARFPAVFAVWLYPLAEFEARQRRLDGVVLGLGLLGLLLGLRSSSWVAARLTRPVEAMVRTAEENRHRRREAETALTRTNEALQMAARFSADASHQLKTPVTVLRTGLEELGQGAGLSAEAQEAVGHLIRQTGRLTQLIEDLLLLSRLDARRLQLAFAPVALGPLIEAALDDLSAGPDPFGLEIEAAVADVPPVSGEQRYLSLIVTNLVDNAAKYNRPGGRIRVRVGLADGWVSWRIANTARQPIRPLDQPRIFDRFHRGGQGEDLPGNGLGLNLARELVLLHHGEIRLVGSDAAWTEFEVRLRPIG